MEAASTVFSHYMLLINNSFADGVNLVGGTIPIPRFEESIIESICDQAIETLKIQPKIPHIENNNVFIVGDIHGNILDLMRILYQRHMCGHIIFLGDYVNRGDFSLECIELIFSLFVLNPTTCTLIRGNHEFRCVNKKFQDLYDISPGLYEKINEVFDYLPFCCTFQIPNTNEKYFCVHGGITSSITRMTQIEEIERPLKGYENCKIAKALVWADPGQEVGGTLQTSRRGTLMFTRSDVEKFLSRNGFSKIIRGHEFISQGVKVIYHQQVITVFSSSNYCGGTNNAGYLAISLNGIQIVVVPLLKQYVRSETHFSLVKMKNKKILSQSLAVKSSLNLMKKGNPINRSLLTLRPHRTFA